MEFIQGWCSLEFQETEGFIRHLGKGWGSQMACRPQDQNMNVMLETLTAEQKLMF